MFKIIALLFVFSTQVYAAPLTTGTGITVVGIANDTGTGTTQNKLVKLTSSSKVIIAGTSDIDGIIGVVLNGAGISGTAQVISSGIALCAFDGTATAGHYVGISSSVAGDCADVGTSLPLTGQAIGYVLTGGSGAATYTIVMQIRSADGVNGILSPAHGGTGVNNGSNVITLSGNLTILNGTSITPTTTGIGVWASGNITGSNTPLISNAVAPATPSAGTTRFFVDSTDKRLHDINDAGTIGTTVVANTGASNNFLTSISSAGVVARAQPSFSNISGTIATGQVSGSYTGITGVGTLTAGATGAGFTLAFGTSTLTGQIPLANGGTNANLTASNGGIFYSTGSAAAILAGTVTAGQCLLSGSSAAPTWGSCAGGASVTSIAGNTGAFTLSNGITNSTNDIRLSSIATGTMLANTSGSSAVPTATALPNGQLTEFIASGTFTTPANSTTATIYVYRACGAGGGGGGLGSAAVTNGAGGGGSGAYMEGTFTSVAASTGITITIGAGGTAGANTGTTGGTGGSTVIGTPVSVTAGGGLGGVGTNTNGLASPGGPGGTTSGSPTLSQGGGTGQAGAPNVFGGSGAGQFFGTGGFGGSFGATVDGATAVARCTGGGGAGHAGQAGGVGGGGWLSISEVLP